MDVQVLTILATMLAITLTITGGGRWSLDRSVDRRERLSQDGSGSASHVLLRSAPAPADGSATP